MLHTSSYPDRPFPALIPVWVYYNMPLLTPTWFDYDDINRDPTAQVPPYNLLASVPRELKGTVMLLECSDPAKILFTLHEDHNPDCMRDSRFNHAYGYTKLISFVP